MILQYEILALGFQQELKGNSDTNERLEQNEINGNMNSFLDITGNQPVMNSEGCGYYTKFANFFCDDKSNLKDIMEQLGNLGEEELRIKEELFMLLSFFIITFENRQDRIKNIILKNKDNLVGVIKDF